MSNKVLKINKTEELCQPAWFTTRSQETRCFASAWMEAKTFFLGCHYAQANSCAFLDEPTGGVDPATRRQFWDLIYNATEQGITVFVTTHYLDEAEYCNRLSIMVDGKIEALDTPGNLKQQFKMNSMDEVFYYLARGGKERESDEDSIFKTQHSNFQRMQKVKINFECRRLSLVEAGLCTKIAFNKLSG